jgi:aminoglycoside phosphotransferase family enzyme/predicted kinase
MTKPDEKTGHSNLPAAGEDIVSSLSRKQAFPVPVDSVEVRQTHISEVFLGDNVVYKVKKPVKLPFLDFSTVELRHHFCQEEVRINSPWAPGIYLGVVPITNDADGYRFEGEGPVADWAVKMRRLPESVTLRSRLNRGDLSKHDCERVARRIAEIHRTSTPAFGNDATNAVATFRSQFNDNWQFAEQLRGDIVDRKVMERIRSLSDKWLDRAGDLLQTRAKQGLIRDVHGDLRLEHVFYFPETSPPGDIVILDGIEFDPGLRLIDVVADIAFMTMELSFVGRRDLAEAFADAYFTASGDSTGRDVLPLFAAYRSAVRAKVAAILATEPEVPEVDRSRGLARSRSHWLWCLSELETPGMRPALVLVSGLPGTGKSTLARSLSEQAHFEVIRSDVIRKEIFTVGTSEQTGSLYTSDRTQRIYDECLERARRLLQAGKRVIVDATFQRDQDRQTFLQLAIDCGSRAIWLECTAPAEITRQRIDARHGDASDADWSVYQLVSSRWQPASEPTERFHQRIETGASGESPCDAAMIVLRQSGIVD